MATVGFRTLFLSAASIHVQAALNPPLKNESIISLTIANEKEDDPLHASLHVFMMKQLAFAIHVAILSLCTRSFFYGHFIRGKLFLFQVGMIWKWEWGQGAHRSSSS
jgi:hypothetical protein